jgi:peptidoglycan/LPS O-acetylase OafA/YrhL
MTEVKPRFQEFDALRGLSIVLLLALHSEVFDASVFGFEVDPLAHVVAVFLLGSFFFLAGFFAELSRQKTGGDILAFIKSKAIRIFPPYWIALALFIFVLGYTLRRFDTLMYAFNLQWLLSPVFIKQVLTIWYISVLVGYYMIFGILLFRIPSNIGLLIASVLFFMTAYITNQITGLFEPRFFQYFFVFLAGVYFYRFETLRNTLSNLNVVYKISAAVLALLLFWRVASAGIDVRNGIYIVTADLFILSWVWMWLAIFRTGLGSWKIWAFLSTASFFTYLYHRPIWYLLTTTFGIEPGVGRVFFNLILGGLTALILGYYLQRGYDRLLAALRFK